MLSSVCLGSNDLARSGRFYDAVLGTIGMKRLIERAHEFGYGSGDKASLWVLVPFDGRPATWGNGTQVLFLAPDKAAVQAFHAAALAAGGLDEGAPGPRNYRPGYYGAYCRDPDGNKLHAWCMTEE